MLAAEPATGSRTVGGAETQTPAHPRRCANRARGSGRDGEMSGAHDCHTGCRPAPHFATCPSAAVRLRAVEATAPRPANVAVGRDAGSARAYGSILNEHRSPWAKMDACLPDVPLERAGPCAGGARTGGPLPRAEAGGGAADGFRCGRTRSSVRSRRAVYGDDAARQRRSQGTETFPRDVGTYGTAPAPTLRGPSDRPAPVADSSHAARQTFATRRPGPATPCSSPRLRGSR